MPDVKRNDSESRYEIDLGDGTAVLAFTERNGKLVLTHTEVPGTHEGQGLGGKLVKAAAADARERGIEIVPQCSYARAWFERHPDEADVVAQARD